MRGEKARLLASQLLDQVGIPVEAHVERALSRAYWRELCPFLSVEGPFSPLLERKEITTQRHLETYLNEGYFETESILPKSILTLMQESIERVRREKWPLIFTFIYDQFWMLARLPSFDRLLTAILGSGYKQTSHVWTHYVPAIKGCTGWRPHTDHQHTPTLTVWFSINGATLDNGCIFLVPKDPNTQALTAKLMTRSSSLRNVEVASLLQNIRAVPAAAGAALGWDHDVVHWGSANRSSAPRISVSMEFIGAGVEFDASLFDVDGDLPTFAQRIDAIAKGILNYSRPGSSSAPFEQHKAHVRLARRLADRVSASSRV